MSNIGQKSLDHSTPPSGSPFALDKNATEKSTSAPGVSNFCHHHSADDLLTLDESVVSGVLGRPTVHTNGRAGSHTEGPSTPSSGSPLSQRDKSSSLGHASAQPSSSASASNLAKAALHLNTSTQFPRGFEIDASVALSDGEGFSSDAGITRAVRVTMVPATWMREQIASLQARNQLLTWCIVERVGSPEAGNELWTVHKAFDDLRHAGFVVDNWPKILPGSHIHFIPMTDAVPSVPAWAPTDVTSKYAGQLLIDLQWTSRSQDADLTNSFDLCNILCRAYGEIRCFALVKVDSPVRATFRVEFHSLSAEICMLHSTGIGRRHELENNHAIVVSRFRGFASTPSNGAPSNLALPPSNPPPIHVSPTKRTAWCDGKLIAGATLHTFPSQMTAALPGTAVAPYQYPEPAGDYLQSQDQFSPVDNYHAGAPFSSTGSSTSTSNRRHARNADDDNHRAQAVDIQSIEEGLDVRTTLMIRNIPNRMTAEQLKAIIDPHCRGLYDFLYLRLDFSSGYNVGYGFINFIDPAYIVPFLKGCVGQQWPGVRTNKLLEVSYATIQGLECLVQKFRNSSVMMEYAGARPKLFYTSHDQNIPPGCQPGDEAPFPEPDNRSKRERSIANAQTIGLFPPRSSRFERDGRPPRSQYDRGTPRALSDEIQYHARRSGYPNTAMNNGVQTALAPRDYGPVAPPPLGEYDHGPYVPRYVPDYPTIDSLTRNFNGFGL